MRKLTLSILAALAILATGCAKKATNYISEDGFAQGSTFHIVYEPQILYVPTAFQLQSGTV